MVYLIISFSYRKADDKISSANFAKYFKSKLYHIENSKIRQQTVKILMRWLIMSHLMAHQDLRLFLNSAIFASGS